MCSPDCWWVGPGPECEDWDRGWVRPVRSGSGPVGGWIAACCGRVAMDFCDKASWRCEAGCWNWDWPNGGPVVIAVKKKSRSDFGNGGDAEPFTVCSAREGIETELYLGRICCRSPIRWWEREGVGGGDSRAFLVSFSSILKHSLLGFQLGYF